MTKIPLLERKLNPEQQRAVEHGKGPLLIIAGAGTGKTTVVTERIKHLITSGWAKPNEILALTFTEKAAREMETRVDETMPYGYTQMWIATFHKFCDQILRSDAIHIGLNSSYQLLSDADATMLFRKNLFTLNFDYFRPLGNPNKFISGILQHFSRLKDEDVTPAQYAAWVNFKFQIPNSKKTDEELSEIIKYEELARAYTFYEGLKIKEGFMDFGNLIANTLLLFRTRKNILENYRRQFKFILVDEFQDTNVAQYELIKLLVPPNENPDLTVVGDDNQSVYKFRGAAVSNIVYFKEDYKKAQQIVLNKNYRSYQYILDSAYKLIKYNDPDTLEAKLGISKKLVSIRQDGQKHKVELIHTDRVENEAEMVAKEIRRLHSVILSETKDPVGLTKNAGDSSPAERDQNDTGSTYNWKDFVILVRANSHAEPFVRVFTRQGVPYQFLGHGQLFRQPEIKDLIAYLQVLRDFSDSSAFFRVLSMAYFGISSRDLVAITTFAKRYNLPLFEASEVVAGKRTEKVTVPIVSQETKKNLEKLVVMVERHLSLVTKETAGQILYYFLEDSGMIKNILEYSFPLDEQKAENITKFFNKLKNYEGEHEDASVGTVLDWIMLSMELGESPLATDTDWTDNDAVNILTVHSAKGLEFPIVFLVNLVSLRFPTTERREQIPIPDELVKEILPQGDPHLEEERRLFYVGMTRARDRLYLTAADYYGEGKRTKKISPFVIEALGKEAIIPVEQKEQQLSLLDWQKIEQQRNPEASLAKGTTLNVKITYLSYSQIETFRMCPLHYKLKYIFKIPTPPSPSLSFGTSIHNTLRDFYHGLQNDQEVTQEKLLELFQNNWIREGFSEKRYEDLMFKRGQEFLFYFFQNEFDPETKTLLLEQPFTVPLKNEHGRLLKIGGKIDRIDDKGKGTIEIVDYKTGRMPSKREIDANLQLSMYALAATHIPETPFGKDIADVILTLYYFDSKQKISTTRTREQLEEEKVKILKIAEEIEKSDFRCSGNQLCTNCEYKLFCGVSD